MKLSLLSILFLSLAMFISCSSDEEKLSSENELKTFVVENVDTKIENNQIILTFPTHVNKFVIKPVITISDKAQVYPSSESEIDLSLVKQYTVTAEDGTLRTYSIVIYQHDGIKSVGIKYKDKYFTQTSNGIINVAEKTITIDVPYTYLINSSFFISSIGDSYSTSVPKNDEAIDGENQTILYDKVVFMDKNFNKTDEYKLIVRNTDAELTNISLPVVHFGINPSIGGWVLQKYAEGIDEWDYVYFILDGQDVSNIVPTLTYSKNATIKPRAGESINFNNIVDFEITSESGITKTRKVKVVKKKIIIVNDHDRRSIHHIDGNSNLFVVYNAISLIKNAWLLGEDSDTLDCTVSSSSPYNSSLEATQGGYYTQIWAPMDMPKNKKYQLRVELENGDIVDTDTYWRKSDL